MIETAVILSTGDELTTGKVIDTNSRFIADRLFALGIRVAAVIKVGDDREMLRWAFGQARDQGDIVIGTGGLGPTADDLTTELVSEFLGVETKLDERVAAALKERFAKGSRAFTNNNLKQAVFPMGAEIIPNPNGTAPGFRVDLGGGKKLMWLSGVPQEMSVMLRDSVIPWIAEENGGQTLMHEATFKLYGITESQLDDLMKPLELGRDARLAFRAHFPDLTLRLIMNGGAIEAGRFANQRGQIKSILRDYIYADSERTMEEVVGQLLLQNQLTLALAESCTGGLISRRITSVAGSSAYFLGAAITYSNAEKVRALGVSPETLARFGAVSQATALEMSQGVRRRTGADLALSVTGVAGPAGGSPDKPVGTVWVSICQENFHQAKLLNLSVLTDRERIVQGTAQAALNWLRQRLAQE